LEALAARLRPLLAGATLAGAYNEFCAPTLEEAAATLVASGARRIAVVPSMLTPGGVHSEIEIPAALDDLRTTHPAVRFDYAWPFDLHAVGRLPAPPARRQGGGG